MRECESVFVATMGSMARFLYNYLFFRVSNLQRNDEGVWKCNRGDHGENDSSSIQIFIFQGRQLTEKG